MRKIKKIVRIIIVLVRYVYYKLYCVFVTTNENNIWIISERGDDARDNSYHFFKYVRENHPEINIKYVISSNSPDYDKVSCYGKTIPFGSKEHYVNMIRASVLISTHPLGFTPNKSLFLRLQKMGLYNPKSKIIHLKHGITKDNISFDGLKFDLIVAGAKPEYDFMVRSFKELGKAVEYTGFARFDALKSKNNKKKRILIMPTFRKWLYYSNNEDFKNSSYFKNFQNLLLNRSLIDLLNKNNYEVLFYPHYRFQERLKLFETISDRVKLASFSEYDVQELLINCDLLITDYSSVFFDFAYMNKPIVYFQFDFDEYRDKHYKEGYFKYEENGFGPIADSVDGLVIEIGKIIKNNCSVAQKYSKRIKGFYLYNDRNNCERIYNKIKEIVDEK